LRADNNSYRAALQAKTPPESAPDGGFAKKERFSL
jgi:hypothetical protein